ncbi:hypothetical protein OEZ85_003168 [Tetradesmus obliquus]|uniref:Lysosomal Pro-X carboxypeptidase n=1 Tax=Tetradesmus obliquus TaxID=3088 RepID=A0ABY8TZR5_TETOB|nr:hypothetical protein OEZ85_003168 [Tetradesmus obliquus]
MRPPKWQKGHSLSEQPDLVSRCTLLWRNATLDHFTWREPENGTSTFQQRVFICDEFWQPAPNRALGPIFFYLGNEADVTLYLNHTGLMWENAAHFGALLIFAEHRYYGQSKPWGADVRTHMGYLTAEQALADYAEVIQEVKAAWPGAQHSAVIGFGGRQLLICGMLAAWMRLKYPHLLVGAIAASAPIWNFYGQDPPFDELAFAKGVTYDATPEAGAAPGCVQTVRRAWEVLMQMGAYAGGRADIAAAMRLCPETRLNSKEDVLALREYLASAWDYLAMGNFPYPSSYMTNGAGDLPAYPVRVACEIMVSRGTLDGPRLMEGLAQAAGVLYNFSGSLPCLAPGSGPSPESDEDANFWDYQWCTEMVMPASKDGVSDMFYKDTFNFSAAVENCKRTWGVAPRSKSWPVTQWGGRNIAAGSNIVFSNGLLDPWHGGGVMDDVSKSLVAVVIPEGAHHLDLMFSHPLDPPSVLAARRTQLRRIKHWIKQAARRHSEQQQRLQWWRQQQPGYEADEEVEEDAQQQQPQQQQQLQRPADYAAQYMQQ